MRAGITNLCIHKGLLPADYETKLPDAWRYATVDDVGKAAKDWPQMNFIIYHAALRAFLENTDADLAEFERTGYIRWTSDLAAPEKFGVAMSSRKSGLASRPQRSPTHASVPPLWERWSSEWAFCRPHFLGLKLSLVRLPAMADRGAPGLGNSGRHAEKAWFCPARPADGDVKNAIFGVNGARHYHLDLRAAMNDMPFDGIAKQKAAYLENGGSRSNAAYGYVMKAG